MFSISSCAKCGGGMFKVVTQEPAGSNYKLNFIQCSSCNAPIGVVDYYNTGAQLEEQKALINKLGSRLANLEHNIYQIAQILQHR